MLNKHNFELARLADSDNQRYNIAGIQVHSDKTIETNGAHLVIVGGTPEKAEDFPVVDGVKASETFEPFVLARNTALEVARAIPRRISLPVLRHAGVSVKKKEVKLIVTDLENPKVFPAKPVEEKFPEYEKAIPTEKPVFEICLSAEYLRDIMALFAKISGRGSDTIVRFRFYGREQSTRMDMVNNAYDGQYATAVLMPMRFEEITGYRKGG